MNKIKYKLFGCGLKTAISLMLTVMLCLTLACGASYAADTHNLSGVQVGDIITTGDIIQNDNNTILLAYYGQTVNSFGGNGREILTGNDSFPMGRNSAIDSPYWQVSKIGDNGFQQGITSLYMILTPVSEKPGASGTGIAIPMREESFQCDYHNYEWMIAYDATNTTDGQKMYVCEHCGHVESTAVIPAYGKFLEETIEAILSAKPDTEVNVDTNLWLSFSKDVAAALKQNPDVTVNITFRYDGYKFKITLPPRYNLTAMMNSDGFAGFALLATDPIVNLTWIP